MRKARTFEVEWASVARSDLAAIISFIAEDSVEAALSTLDKIERTAEKLTTMPLRGRVVPELALFGIHSYHELIVSPWRILHEVSGRSVRVVAVVDGRRSLEDLLLERFLR